jgi:hypothetical protein
MSSARTDVVAQAYQEEFLRITIILLAFVAAAYGGPVNLVQNGGFETGDLTGWTNNPTTSRPWTVDEDSHSGTFAVQNGCIGAPCINGNASAQDTLAQTIATNVGDSYTLSFFYDPGQPGNTGQFSELLAQWGDTTAIDLVQEGSGIVILVRSAAPAAGVVTPAAGYNQYTVSGLIATGTTMELNLLGRQDTDSKSLLDDVVLTDDTVHADAPEPSTYLFAAGGLLALGLLKLRRG